MQDKQCIVYKKREMGKANRRNEIKKQFFLEDDIVTAKFTCDLSIEFAIGTN